MKTTFLPIISHGFWGPELGLIYTRIAVKLLLLLLAQYMKLSGPPLLRSLCDLLGASILLSFICSGRPQGESLHLIARSKFIIICSCSHLSWRLSSSLLDRKPPVEWPLAFLYQTRPKTHHHSFQVISSNLHDWKSGHSHCLWKKCTSLISVKRQGLNSLNPRCLLIEVSCVYVKCQF